MVRLWIIAILLALLSLSTLKASVGMVGEAAVELAGARVTVVGLARSGVAAARLLQAAGHVSRWPTGRSRQELTAVLGGIDREHVGVTVGARYESALDEADLVVISPGVPYRLDAARSGASAWRESDQRIGVGLAFLPEPAPGGHRDQRKEHDRDLDRQVSCRERQAGLCRRQFGHRLERSGGGRPARQTRQGSRVPTTISSWRSPAFSLKRSINSIPGSPPCST